MTAVLVCDDRFGVRERLARVLVEVDGVESAECVGNGELLGRYSQRPADVVLVGIQGAAPGGLNAVKSLVGVHGQAKVIVFGSPEDAASIAAAVVEGAAGFLRWDVTNPPRRVGLIGMAVAAGLDQEADQCPRLTERELRILTCMSQGYTTDEITRELLLPRGTVKTYARRLFDKLGVCDRAGAVGQGFRHDLVH